MKRVLSIVLLLGAGGGADRFRPVTMTQGELDHLQAELDHLASEVAALKAEVASLTGPSKLPPPPKLGETADDMRIFLRDHRNTCHVLSDQLVSGGEQLVIAVFSPVPPSNHTGPAAGSPPARPDLHYTGKLRVTIKNGWIDQTTWEAD